MATELKAHKAHPRMPAGLSYSGAARPVGNLEFLRDRTWVDSSGKRQVEQQIFDAVFDIVRRARRLLVLDYFLLNAFQGRVAETTRLLSSELVEALIEQRRLFPDLTVVLITDPLNIVYGARPSEQFMQLRDAGVRVVITDLTQLRDSSPVYSRLWRWFIRPFGVGRGGLLKNPLAPNEKVGLRSYLSALNFKANHRKVILADDGADWAGLVTSANPHDASSAHHNVAVRFAGAAVADLLETENAVLGFCGEAPIELDTLQGQPDGVTTGTSIRILTEAAVKTALLQLIGESVAGEQLDLATFYLADRATIRAVILAHGRGVKLRLLLDPNKDAFGHDKRGIPNRPVAAELTRAGIAVRWVHTHGEQCHAKLLLHRGESGERTMLLGSSNLTRRNLDDFNLETDVLVHADLSVPLFQQADLYFSQLWDNEPGRHYSVEYAHYEDDSLSRRLQYRIGEWTGFCTW